MTDEFYNLFYEILYVRSELALTRTTLANFLVSSNTQSGQINQ